MNNEKFNQPQTPANTGWENMTEYANNTPERANADRHKRKIISAMLYDRDALYKNDVALPQDAEQQYANAIRDGRITSATEAALLSTVADPVQAAEIRLKRDQGFPETLAHEVGLNQTFVNLATSRQEMRILGYMTAGPAGFENFAQNRPESVETFLKTFPTPADFEEAKNQFMSSMQNAQSPSKYAEYVKSMDDFLKHIYGKKQEYYEGLKELREQAQSQTPTPEPQTLRLETTSTNNFETLRPRDAAVYKVSRNQVQQGLSAYPGETIPDLRDSEDAELIQLSHGLFGVFDGAGGHAGGRAASQTAKKFMESISATPVNSPEDLAQMLNAADVAIRDNPEAGITTGVIAKTAYDAQGRKIVMWASVGDSRLYLVPSGFTAKAQQITRDEGYGRVITNALGMENDDYAEDYGRARQYGSFYVKPGDRLVLCSDGITGDKEPDLMSEKEITKLVKTRDSAMSAARRLVENARKTDDRTAVVVEI